MQNVTLYARFESKVYTVCVKPAIGHPTILWNGFLRFFADQVLVFNWSQVKSFFRRNPVCFLPVGESWLTTENYFLKGPTRTSLLALLIISYVWTCWPICFVMLVLANNVYITSTPRELSRAQDTCNCSRYEQVRNPYECKKGSKAKKYPTNS